MESQPATRLRVKVVPGSSREGLVGRLGEAWKIAVRAPPEAGRANDAVEALLARLLDVDRRAVRVVLGRASPRKSVEITGLSPDDAERRLLAAMHTKGSDRHA